MVASKRVNFGVGIVTCCFLFASLTACTPKISGIGNRVPEIRDGGFLSSEPCAPPCFWGIIPGITTEAEAIELLQSEGLCRKYTTFDHSGGVEVFCSSGVEISIQQGTDTIDVVIFRPSQTITVGDAITRYGAPDTISVGVKHQYPRVWMVLNYAHLKVSLVLAEQEGSTFWVEASTEVERINYYSTASFEYYKTTTDSKWNGYGEYQEYLPRE